MMTLPPSSVDELKARFARIVAPIAHKFNLSVNAFEEELFSGDDNETINGNLILSDAYGTGLNPAPITPTTGSKPWELLSSVILRTFQSNQRDKFKGGKYAVAPALSLGESV